MLFIGSDECVHATYSAHCKVYPPASAWLAALTRRLTVSVAQFAAQSVRAKYGDDWARISRMSIIEEGGNDK